MNNSNELHLAIDDGFIGSPYSPRVDITETDSGHEISITSKKPEGIVEDTLDIPDADWQRAEDAREAAESSRVRAENSRKAEWNVISADATSATSAANDAADSANQAADAANAAAESATDAESDLRAAAARGDFDGFSPVVDIDDGASSHTITITDREGDHSYTVPTYAADESARAAAETARVSAESNRVSAESLRVSAEGLRASAESARATAESSRASAESSRRSAENSRVIAETSRVNAESSRVLAEIARAQAEAARDEAEGLRDSDEQARVSAETARATEWAEIESEAQSTIDAAQDAASDATAAAAEARAASAATWLSGNVLFGELAEDTVLTAGDVYAAPARDVDVYGVSTQVQTTGKNLFDINGVSFVTNAADTTKTDTGVTVTANLASGWSYVATMIEVSNVSSVTLSTVPSKSNPRIGFEGYYSDNTIAVTKSALANSVTATLPDGVVKVRCIFYSRQTSSGAVGDTCTYNNIQLELGSTATSYEPYTGGKAAPSPDYPQEIKSVDDLTLVLAGKNLFDYPTETWTNTNAYRYNSNTFAGGYRSIPEGVTTITASMYIDNSAASDTSMLNTWARKSDGTMVAIGGSTVVPAGSKARVSKTYNVSEYVDFGLGASLAPNASASQLMAELGTTATAYEPYVGQSIPIPLSDHVLSSLPNGTRDTLTLSYIGPAQTEGWGVFSKTLVQRAGTVDMGTLTWSMSANYFYAFISDKRGSLLGDIPNVLLCTEYQVEPVTVASNNLHDGFVSEMYGGTNRGVMLKNSNYTTAADLKASLSGAMLQYLFATPITTDLGTVELPVNPAPDLTAWADGGSAQPTLAMSYEQDINIVIARLKDAIADMATS